MVLVPTGPAYLFEEGGVHPEVFGHHVQTEQVSVDAVPRHGQPVEVLVLLRSFLEQPPALLRPLSNQTTVDR